MDVKIRNMFNCTCTWVFIAHIYLLFTFSNFVRSRIYRFLVVSALIFCTASMSLVGPFNAPYNWAPTKEHFRNIEDLYRYIQRLKTYKFFARHRFSRPRYLQKWKRKLISILDIRSAKNLNFFSIYKIFFFLCFVCVNMKVIFLTS